MSAGTAMMPCPFCGAALKPFGPAQHNHPENQCWLRSVRIMDVDRAFWNSRPALPDSERDAALAEYYRASVAWQNCAGHEDATVEDENKAEARFDAARSAADAAMKGNQ